MSVVVPVHNEEQSVGELLESLREQTRTPDEVVVCDGGSTDRTVAVVERFSNCGLPVRLLRTGAAFPGRARNLAIQAARFDLIALTDAGIRLDPRWLEHLVAPFESDRPPDVVYGRYEPVHTSFRQRCIGLAFVPPRDPRSGLRGPSVASMAMSHNVWTRAGGFRDDLRSGEDLLFMRAISARRLSARYAPAAVAYWNPPRDFAVMFRRFAAFSRSGMRAGLAQEWQVPLLRIYLLVFALTLAALWTPVGYLAPVVILGVRAAKRVVRELGLLSLANVPLVVGVTVALGMIDVATFEGFRRWVIADWIPGLGRRRVVRLARSRDSAP